DLVKARPGLAPARPAAGIAPQLADAELAALAVIQAHRGFVSERRFPRYARRRLRRLFPCLPAQAGYSKRLRGASALMRALWRFPATGTSLRADDVRVIDPAPAQCGRSRETAKRPNLADGPSTATARAQPAPASQSGPEHSCSSRHARPSSRSTRPSRDNRTSSATAGAAPRG
ncbi:MAG: hypothetical protein ABSB59_44745, partial [Streptosporangiaceae bacterium]